MKLYWENHRIRLLQICILLVFGLTYSFTIPPFEAPDEAAHFARAYSVAEGQFILRDHPAKLVQFIKEILEERHDAQSMPLLGMMNFLLEQQDDRIPNLAYNSSLYSPVAYLFHAFIIKALMFFGDSRTILYITFYLCRVLSVFLFVGFFYLASRMSSSGTWPLFWTAITPMALSQTGVVSTDCIVYGSAFVIISAGIGNLDGYLRPWCFIISVFFLLMTKVTYIPLLIIPAFSMLLAKKGERNPEAKIFLIGMGIALLGSIIWNYILIRLGIYKASLQIVNRINNYSTIVLNPSVILNPSAQIAFIIHFPFEFIKVIFHTLSTSGVSLFHQFVGILGWLDLPIPSSLVLLWAGGACASVSVAERPKHLSERASIIYGTICIFAAALTFLAICASAYIIWMPIGSMTINLQGRYFHPIVAAILVGAVLIKPSNLKPRFETITKFSLLSVSILINLVAVHTLLYKYGIWWSG